MAQSVIFHVDVNSAFLSWTAAYRKMVLGEEEDLRRDWISINVRPGDRAPRHSIILAKSTSAKKYGIHTGEPLFQALEKCPQLKIVQPDYGLYVEASRHFVELLLQYSPAVEQYSIDESFINIDHVPEEEQKAFCEQLAAEKMRQQIWEELGFTVNIGISSNKLLAKMAGDFEKPNKVHTLFPEEVADKMWPLPVRDLFLVGAATEKKLGRMGIYTIGELAKADPQTIRKRLGKQGETLWQFANGYGSEKLITEPVENKGYGNSVTTPSDVVTTQEAHKVLLSLCETVGMRLRKDNKCASCVSVMLRTSSFISFSHQMKLHGATNRTQALFEQACRIFDEAWDKVTPLRQLGVQVSQLSEEEYRQFDMFSEVSPACLDRKLRLDETVDALRDKFGESIVQRAKFIGGESSHMTGGLSKERRTGITKPIPKEF